MKKTAILLLIIICGLATFPLQTFAEESEERNFTISAQAVVLMEQSSGRVLYENNQHESLRIASITKIMTAMLAIESGKMDEVVTVSERAEGTEGSSIYLRRGDKMKLSDLVYGLMLRSGNDAAMAIAEHVGGSVEGFVVLMNEKASEIGMSNTLFQNPHGLDDHEEHYSSAYDMALLTQYAMANEDYQTITSTKSHRVEESDVRWKNKNRLLTELYPHSTGGKTGFTKRASRTLVSTASKDGLDLIVVTLNAPSDWYDHMNLFDWGFENFTLDALLNEGIIKEIKDDFYKNKVYAEHDFIYPLTEGERAELSKEITLYKPPKDAGRVPRPVGKIEFKLNEQIIGAIPLYYEQGTDEKKGFWKRVFEIFFTIAWGETK